MVWRDSLELTLTFTFVLPYFYLCTMTTAVHDTQLIWLSIFCSTGYLQVRSGYLQVRSGYLQVRSGYLRVRSGYLSSSSSSSSSSSVHVYLGGAGTPGWRAGGPLRSLAAACPTPPACPPACRTRPRQACTPSGSSPPAPAWEWSGWSG